MSVQFMPASPGSSTQSEPENGWPKVTIDIAQRTHHRGMMRLGIAGAAIGCLLGTFAVTVLPYRYEKYCVIAPFALTYIGLAIGFFVAGLSTAVKRLQKRPQHQEVDLLYALNGGQES